MSAVAISDVVVLAGPLFSGLLAGEELAVRYGLRDPVARLDAAPQIQLRQALIRRLRILVPAIFFLALASGAGAVLLTSDTGMKAWRVAGLFALLVFITVTLAGTVPINQAILTWKSEAPPEDWRVQIARWERLDTARTWAAVAAFVLLLIGSAWW